MAEQTLLQIVQDECRRQGLEVPVSVVSATDQTTQQMLGLLNEEVEAHANREYVFQQLNLPWSFIYSLDPNYMALDLGGVTGYSSMLPKTLWNNTLRLPVVGPYTDPAWQAMLVLQVSGAMQNYRIAGGDLLIYPGSSAPQTYTFRYRSKYAVITSLGVYQETFTADTDTPALPSRILKAGLRWRWRAEKGQQYAEQLDAYEAMLQTEAHLGENPGELRMDDIDDNNKIAMPGLLIAAGSWNV